MNAVLKNRDWSYPLESLDKKFDEVFDSVTAEKFHMARGDFLMEWRHLEILWGRLQEDYRFFYTSQSQFKEGDIKDYKNNMRIGMLLMRSLDCIHLDTDCFLINARILMDGLARLTTFFWRKIARKQPKWRSFNAHVEWFMEPKNQNEIIDKNYAQYITQNTGWFKDKLKPSRDNLIVHRFSSDVYHVNALKSDSGTAMRGKSIFKSKEGNVVVEYDMSEMPDLDELMNNICNFLSFFDKHFSL